MPTLEEIKSLALMLSVDDRAELLKFLEEDDERQWEIERDAATRAFHEAGLTDCDIDEAVRKMRYENRP